jgi:hypothetical protein
MLKKSSFLVLYGFLGQWWYFLLARESFKLGFSRRYRVKRNLFFGVGPFLLNIYNNDRSSFFFALFRLSVLWNSSSETVYLGLLVSYWWPGIQHLRNCGKTQMKNFTLSDQHKSKQAVSVKVHLCLKKKGLILTSFGILLFFILKIGSDQKRDFHNLVTNSSFQGSNWGVRKWNCAVESEFSFLER